MNNSGAGGAGTHAGVDFQQRVVAYFATAMLTHVDVAPMLAISESLYIERISMETADCVDDFVLTCEGDRRLFVQAKLSPTLSPSPESDFAAAVKQFVSQYCIRGRRDELYLLAVGPTASGRIRQQLRKLLSAIRYDVSAWKTAPLTQPEKDVLQAFLLLVRKFAQQAQGGEWTEVEVIRFAQQVYVATFDMADSGSDCRTAYLLLHTLTRLKSPADLVWSRLTQLCLDASSKRLQTTKGGLRTALARFVQEAEKEHKSQAFFETAPTGSVESGKEIVLLLLDASKLLLAEFQRFDGQGQFRVKFTKDKCIFGGGEYVLLHRAATAVGMERYLVRNSNVYTDRELVIVPGSFDEDPNLSNAAKARAEWLQIKLKQLGHGLNCLNCGRPVSSRRATVIEVDDSEHPPDAGVVHEGCVQPMHRVLGEMTSKFFEDNPHIIDFDTKLWVAKLRTGQGLLAGLREAGNPGDVRVGWNPVPIELNRRYCIRALLSDGSRPAMLRRGKVHRFSVAEAKEKLSEFQRHLAESVRAGDPYFMSADGRIFGRRSLLAKVCPQEFVSECISAEIVPYSREIGEEFDRWENYYAPLILVRVGDKEELLKIRGTCVFLSDVLRVEEHFLNWAAAGIILSDFYLEILADDAAFDKVMAQNVAAGSSAVIDPLLAQDGTIVSGTVVVSISSALDETYTTTADGE